MKPGLFLSLLLLSGVSPAWSQKNIRGLINAEKQFAWFTASHTVKEGFLNYMDSAGIIFRNGAAVNAQEAFRKQNAGAGILNWEPAFAVISASGDMGATTGPYEFRAKTIQDTPVGRGHFFSVWRINAAGEWKNIADFGSSSKMPATQVQKVKEIILDKLKPGDMDQDGLMLLDKKFNTALQDRNIGGWMPYTSTDSWLNLDGQLPAMGMLQIADVLQKLPEGLKITTTAGELSSAKDLGYTYGTVVNGSQTNNYLRVWIYRNRQWQVIMQTLKW
ncbi:MAG: hypothetical protein JO301_09590 [Chitinophagaceae bacterium]|nr:hypothetical protein [Chitinophagaceae bacterium]